MNIVHFVNSPVPSNTYILWLKSSSDCIIIDPGSKNPTELLSFLDENRLVPTMILLTHEHFDHVWGTNIIRDKYNSKIVCSRRCAEKLSIPQDYFNLLYFNDDNPFYIKHFDIIIDDNPFISWLDLNIQFIKTPGHSSSSICIYINGFLFTGDTIMKGFKPVIKKRHEGSIEELRKSINFIFKTFHSSVNIFPGHGESFYLHEVVSFYKNYLVDSKC